MAEHLHALGESLRELRLECLRIAGGDIDRAQVLVGWVCSGDTGRRLIPTAQQPAARDWKAADLRHLDRRVNAAGPPDPIVPRYCADGQAAVCDD